jgi:hypothetical protein
MLFCNQCGTELQPDYKLCPKCGQSIGPPVRPGATTSPGRLERHLRTLGILWIVAGALFLIPSVIALAVGSIAHIAIPGSEGMVRAMGPLVLYLIGGSLLLVGAGGICVGWGLMQRQPWARIVALILGILALFHPPFGTALGIYTLWVLLSNNAGTEYERMAKAA